MKTLFITVLFHTPIKEIERLKKEVQSIGLKDYQFLCIDNTKNNRGYSVAVNEGIRKGLKEKADLFVILNPDVSLIDLKEASFIDQYERFDLWGYAMLQKGQKYYGGSIDALRMSGGLITAIPKNRYMGVDFVSGSLMCIKKEVIKKVGLFNEEYFMYYEDVEYCYRAHESGFKVGIDSKVVYKHFENSEYTAEKERLLAEGRVRFLNSFGNFKQKVFDFLYRIVNNSFLINFFSLNISSLVVKLTSFINFLFLVKYLTAPEYGIYTLVWAQVSILSPLADFGTTSYGIVYLPHETEKTYESLINFRVVVSFFVFLSTIFLSFFLFRGSTKMYGYILVTATVIFTNMFSGSYFIINALKSKLYRSSRNSIIFNIFLVTAIVISLVTFKRLLAVFITIFVFYNLYSIFNYFFIKIELPKFKFKIDIQKWKNIFSKLYVFVLISFFAGLYSRLDVFLLKLMKGETEVGIYSAGSKFLEALLFIAASYNVTATPILARLSHNAKLLKSRITKDILFLLCIGFGIAIAMVIFSPYFLTHVFKKNYLLSIPVLRIVIFALPFILLNSIWLNTLYVLKKPHLAIFVFLLQTVVNLALNVIFIPHYSYIASSYITVFSEFMNCIILIIITRYVWLKTFNKHII